MDGVMPGNVTSIFQGVGDLEAALGRAWSRIAELESILDHYRGTCDECGRANVLVDKWNDDYDYETYNVCWEDPQECQRIAREHQESATTKRREAARRGWQTRRNRASNPRQ